MKPRVLLWSFLVVTAVALLIGWRVDPAFEKLPQPGSVLVWSLFGLFMGSVLIFGANALHAIARGKDAQNEDEMERIVVPALEGRECDAGILRRTEIPRAVLCGVCFGAICGAVIQLIIR